MKKLISALAALFVLAAAVCGAGMAFEQPLRAQVEFADMKYLRPDSQELSDKTEALVKALDSGVSYSETARLLEKFLEGYYNFQTMYSLSRIRYFHDMSREDARREYELCAADFGQTEQLLERVYISCADSSYALRFEKDYFWKGFAEEYGTHYSGRYNDATVRLMEQESELVSEYYSLVSDPVIDIHGQSVKLEEYLASHSGYRNYTAMLEYSRQYNERIGNIYIELVKLRSRLARETGYESTRKMYMESYGRQSSQYEEQVYLDSLAENMRPLYKEVIRRGYNTAELSCDEESLMGFLADTAESVGAEAKLAFEYMNRYGLYDLSPGIDKCANSFTDYLYNYETPYLFLHPLGDTGDYMALAHEFGHFTQMFTDYNSDCSLELAECFSHGMEVLSACRYPALEEEMLCGVLTAFVEQGMFADFEKSVYSCDPDELSVELLNVLCLESAKKFGVSSYINSEYSSMLWMDIPHLFEYPFYVLSYCLAGDVALQLYALESEEKGAGAEIYERLLHRHVSGFCETIEEAGLVSPFASGRAEENAGIFRRRLLRGAKAAA